MTTPNTETFWEDYVLPLVARKRTVPSRSGEVKYRLRERDSKALILERLGTGSTVKITKSKVIKTLQRLIEGAELKFQASPKNGGIDYTVAKEAGIVYALGDWVETDHSKRVFRLGKGPNHG